MKYVVVLYDNLTLGTAFLFIIGSIAICALPPLNGFISEFLIYFGMLKGLSIHNFFSLITILFSIAGLALVGTMAILFSVVIVDRCQGYNAFAAEKPTDVCALLNEANNAIREFPNSVAVKRVVNAIRVQQGICKLEEFKEEPEKC